MQLHKLRILGDWESEIHHYEPNFTRNYLEKTLRDIGDKDQWQTLNQHSLFHHTNNVARNSRGFIDPITMPTLEKLRNLLGLESCQMIILRYQQGESNLYHRDYMPKHEHVERPDVILDENHDGVADSRLERMMLMLQDRKPGHFMQAGDLMINDWKAGDFFYYDSKTHFHSAGCAGPDPRYAIRITGIPTQQFWKFLETTEHHL